MCSRAYTAVRSHPSIVFISAHTACSGSSPVFIYEHMAVKVLNTLIPFVWRHTKRRLFIIATTSLYSNNLALSVRAGSRSGPRGKNTRRKLSLGFENFPFRDRDHNFRSGSVSSFRPQRKKKFISFSPQWKNNYFVRSARKKVYIFRYLRNLSACCKSTWEVLFPRLASKFYCTTNALSYFPIVPKNNLNTVILWLCSRQGCS